MNTTIGKYDLVTAENIMRYLQDRRYELEDDIREFKSESSWVNKHKLPYLEARLHEVHEMLVHVQGDLESMIKEMGDYFNG